MRDYEYFCVLSQDLSEEETSGLLETLKQALVDVGACNIVNQTMGRQRLAYPFPGRQAYGTMALITFSSEPEAIVAFKENVRFEKGVVRSVVHLRVQSGKNESVEDEQPRAVEVKEVVEKKDVLVDEKPVELDNEVEIVVEPKEEPAPVAQVMEKKEQMSQEELDKRIEALLNEEINPDTL